jgi:N-methylhydantoinase A
MKGSGIPVRIPVIEMVEIGAGGGSIARVDKLSRITVGPDSAGSQPGPACYGRGGVEPTVTDANVALGKIDPAFFAGGKIKLDVAASKTALAKAIGAPLSLTGFWPAAGVAEIVEENMANAARVHAVERGHDISSATMIAFGGAAPLHACRFAAKTGLSRIVIPQGAGVGSAIGFLQAPIAYETTRSAPVAFEPFDAPRVNALLNQMIKDARAVVEPALNKRKAKISIVADCRYVGQGHEIRITIPVRTLKASDGAKLKAEFEKSYQQIYNLTIPGQAAEAITWSVTASGPAASAMRGGVTLKRGAAKALRKVKLFDAKLGKEISAPVYWRFDLGRSAKIKGPAIIAEHETSTIVGAGFTGSVDAMGNIILEQKS